MKKNHFFLISILIALFFSFSNAKASEIEKIEARIRSSLAKTLNPEMLQVIRFTGRAGLYEIVTANGIFYTDQFGIFLILGGELVDTNTGVNFTKRTLLEVSKFKFSELPLQDAIKTVIGNGRRVFATFEDPNCSYCKKLNGEIKRLDNVTIYTFVVSILSPHSQRIGRNVLCSDHPSKAWDTVMSGATISNVEGIKCSDIISRNTILYKKLYLSGTPSLLFKDNTITPGFINLDKLEEKLSKN